MTEPVDPKTPPETPKPESARARRRRMQKEVRDRVEAANVKVAPLLAMGGRPRSLDPDQPTLEKNLTTIITCGMLNCTKAEVASQLGVSSDTLREFFDRYPAAEEKFDDARLVGNVSLRRNQFKLSETSAQMAIFLGQQWLGQRDFYKEIEAQGKADAERMRAQHEIEQANSQSRGVPIDIRSLDTKQLGYLLERVRAARAGLADRARDVTPPKPPVAAGSG